MTLHRQPLSFCDRIRAIFQKDTSDEPSAVDVALAACNIEAARLSGLYESLAMRVANLEADLQTTPARKGTTLHVEHIEPMSKSEPLPEPQPQTEPLSPDQLGLEGGLKTGWFRIFRHMLPHKARRLLLEHDHIEEMQLQLQQLRTEATSLQKRLQQMLTEVAILRDQLVRERLREKGLADPGGAAVVKDAPAFPRAIFEATQTSKIAIVDVGAQDLASEEHIYAPLQRAGATSVVGFERHCLILDLSPVELIPALLC